MMKSVCAAIIGWATVSSAYSQTVDGQAQVMWIAMEGRPQFKKAAPGTRPEGKLARVVYWRNTEVFPKGSTVRLVVDQIELRKKTYAVGDRPFLIHLFAPRHDIAARFRSVSVLLPGGAEIPLRATFIALTQRAELRAGKTKPAAKEANTADGKGGRTPKSKQPMTVSPWVLTLQVEPEDTTFPALVEARDGKEACAPATCPEPCTIADGTRMPLALLKGLSASRDHQGQSFQAVLLEPVLVGSKIAIPQGSILQGVLAKRVPPRRLYRPGSLNLLFTHLALPNGADCRFPSRRRGGQGIPHDDGFRGKNPRPESRNGKVSA